jgi:RNA polymerase sigma-70 factor (ECF subfamily)
VRATVDEVVGVEQHYTEEHGDGDDGHGDSVELRVASGQLFVVDRQGDVGATEPLNGGASSGTPWEVTAAASAMRLLPTPAPAPTRAHTPEDEGLLRRAGAGDAAAFREIFVRHRNDVARLVYRMLNAPADLEDVVQEVFVQVFRSLKDFRGQSKFSTWLHRVTVNVVLMHRRSARSRPVFTEEAPGDLVADERQPLPDEEAERCERMRAFQRLLGRLAEKKRVVFILHELEGLAPVEIAEIVGAPVLTVRTRLFYARRELEAMLAEEPSLASLQASFTKRDEQDGQKKRERTRQAAKLEEGEMP